MYEGDISGLNESTIWLVSQMILSGFCVKKKAQYLAKLSQVLSDIICNYP